MRVPQCSCKFNDLGLAHPACRWKYPNKPRSANGGLKRQSRRLEDLHFTYHRESHPLPRQPPFGTYQFRRRKLFGQSFVTVTAISCASVIELSWVRLHQAVHPKPLWFFWPNLSFSVLVDTFVPFFVFRSSNRFVATPSCTAIWARFSQRLTRGQDNHFASNLGQVLSLAHIYIGEDSCLNCLTLCLRIVHSFRAFWNRHWWSRTG